MLWLPFTQMAEFDPSARRFVSAEGNYLIDERGKRLFDAVSSIWTCVHGHCHPYIVEAISKQAAKLDHATLLGATNPVAEELAARLCALCGMDAAFFASDGASAIEAAIKMALHYWQNEGQSERTRIIHLRKSYHGDTAGAMSVSDIEVFKSRYSAITFQSATFDDTSLLAADDVAAVIVEPIVQAAAGMQIIEMDRYNALRTMTPLLIVDEIATGFARTGTMFAFEQLELRPDLLCLGKGLTGGTLALSATLATRRVYEAFFGARKDAKHFFHGHSYAGNPIACAAALASLDIFERSDVFSQAIQLSALIGERAKALRASASFREVRGHGLMWGFELAADDGWPIANALYERGHFTRPIGATIQLVPPLSSTQREMVSFFDCLEEAVST